MKLALLSRSYSAATVSRYQPKIGHNCELTSSTREQVWNPLWALGMHFGYMTGWVNGFGGLAWCWVPQGRGVWLPGISIVNQEGGVPRQVTQPKDQICTLNMRIYHERLTFHACLAASNSAGVRPSVSTGRSVSNFVVRAYQRYIGATSSWDRWSMNTPTMSSICALVKKEWIQI